jgi:hypothetical protein|uniref:porin family protein n=1 Tax=Prevotella sp. TaxID=59823 RepID=UPI0040296D4A
MKKILFVAVMLLASAATFAQNSVGQFTFTPKVGLNIADFQKCEGSDARFGLVAGGEFEYGLSDMVGLSFGALYSMQGAKYKDGGVTETLKADYINIPLLANVYVAPGFAVKLGLQPGFNVNSEYKAARGSSAVTTSVDAKTVDLSIPIGVSYQFDNVVIDGRYNWGLTKVYENSDYKNSVFQITVGYKFAL